ncbi:immunoglobulin superfamily DCC subclass member 3-like [Pontoporia blainvillei]|nr:immunoglobulin superfamily DCC subclass member 3-like [Pontoporia blainvillei]
MPGAPRLKAEGQSCLGSSGAEGPGLWRHGASAAAAPRPRVTLLPRGILHITSVSRADVGTYRCMAHNVANTRHSQDAWLILKDGRSIGVEGIQVLGTGNLMISDVSVQHSGVYVCAANQLGTRVRRTAQGVLLVQAPPEFVQWPQSLSRPPGSSTVFTCMAQGIPEPRLAWLRNGKGLSPGDNVWLTHNNSTLMLAGISAEDEAIYQCVAENSAGSNQASARLAVTGDPEPPPAPRGLQAMALSTSAIRVSWEPLPSNGDITGYVLHLRPAGEPAGPELQEAVGKGTFRHVFSSLEPDTVYSIHLRAYSAEGASQDPASIHASTMRSKPAALYEIKLQAFSGNGDGNSSARVVSLREVPLATPGSLFCWAVPQTASGRAGGYRGQAPSGGKPEEKTELITQDDAHTSDKTSSKAGPCPSPTAQGA